MGIKGYHFYLKKFGGYRDVNLREYLGEKPVGVIIVDFCAVYMNKLRASCYSRDLLLEKLHEKGKTNQHTIRAFALNVCLILSFVVKDGSRLLGLPLLCRSMREIVEGLVGEIYQEIDQFIMSLPCRARVCFVIDGEPLFAKHKTHKTRARKSYQHLKAARKLVNLYLARQTHQSVAPPDQREKFLGKFGRIASGWIRWFGYLKQYIVDELVRRGFANGFDSEGESKYSVVVAPFEADPKCVEVANRCPNSLILSNDGDLQVYPFADGSLVC